MYNNSTNGITRALGKFKRCVVSWCAVRHTGDVFQAATVAPVAITTPQRTVWMMSVEQFNALQDGHTVQKSYATDTLPGHIGDLLDEELDRALGTSE